MGGHQLELRWLSWLLFVGALALAPSVTPTVHVFAASLLLFGSLAATWDC